MCITILKTAARGEHELISNADQCDVAKKIEGSVKNSKVELLIAGVFQKNKSVMEDVVQNHPKVLDGPFKDGFTPLMVAIQKEWVEGVSYLWGHMTYEQKRAVTCRGYSAYHVAAGHESVEILQKVSQELDPLALTDEGYSPLHLAVCGYDLQVVEALLPISDLRLMVEGVSILNTAAFRGGPKFGSSVLKEMVRRDSEYLKSEDFAKELKFLMNRKMSFYSRDPELWDLMKGIHTALKESFLMNQALQQSLSEGDALGGLSALAKVDSSPVPKSRKSI